MTATLKRTGIRRKAQQADPAAFDLVTVTGERYHWPASWMSEKDWQENIIDYAMHGDSETEWFHCVAPKTSRAGFFDLCLFQLNKKVGLLIELKVRDRQGQAKQPYWKQKRFIAAAVACGYDVRVWQFPDDQREAWETLTGLPWEELRR